VHAVWFVDGKTVHMAAGAHDFQPRNPKDDQIYRIIDISDPTKPFEKGRWWYPGTREGDSAPPPPRLPAQFDTGFRAHNTNVFPERPDRAYLGYIDGGAIVLDISNPADIKMVSHWNHSPPFNGFTHTLLPLFERNLWIVSDECVQDDGKDWPKLVWVVDSRLDSNPLPIGTFPAPPYDTFAKPSLVPSVQKRCSLALFSMRAFGSTTPPTPTRCRKWLITCRPRLRSRPKVPCSSTTCMWTIENWFIPLTASRVVFTSSK
ncbi:MAG: hypothetical protein NTX67_06500, partial [Burkholderiales bacterium]|nr:hypothetical protein [Burkholderiales bacterium]